MDVVIERRAISTVRCSTRLHPVLRRAYAARGVRKQRLALTLDRLVPVNTLGHRPPCG
jgi:hypothetical protein